MTSRSFWVAAILAVVATAGRAQEQTPACLPPGTVAVTSADPNLRLLVRLDEPSGTRFDASGEGNDLTPFGNPLSSADHEQGTASLDLVEAQSQYLERTSAELSTGFPGNPGAADTALTVGGWVKANSAGNQPLVIKAEDPDQRSWTMWLWNGVFDPNVHPNGTSDVGPAGDFMGTTPVAVGQWYHFVYTFDGASGLSRLYVNGVLDAGPFDEQIHGFFAGTAPLRLGYRPGFCPDCAYADVLLDEVFVMDRVLSDAEVASVHQYGILDSVTTCGGGGGGGGGGSGLCTSGASGAGATAAVLAPAMAFRPAAKGQGGSLVVRGHMTLAQAVPALDLVHDGVTVQLVSHDGSVLYRVDVPGSAFDGTKGWSQSASGRLWRYRDPQGSTGGVRVVTVAIPRRHPELVRFTVRAKDGSLTIAPSDQPLGLQMLLGTTPGVCAEMQFGPPGRPACHIRASGRALRCG
jgi:hypothetical protein